MRIKQVGNKADLVAITIKNAEASATISAGRPVCFVMNTTDDGLGVVLPGTGAAVKATSFAAGIALQALTTGQVGESQVYGFCQNVTIRKQTRSASTADWSSDVAGFVTGLLLVVDTVVNALSTVASSGGSIYQPYAILASPVASWASTASSDATADTRLTITVSVKAMLRMM